MAHVAKVVLGLKELLISDINGTGLISEAIWAKLANNLEGTFTVTQEDTEKTDINIEESDAPIVQVLKAGAKSFTTSIPDLAFEVAEELFGATKTTEVAEGVSVTRVHLPDSAAYIYKMFKIVPSQGMEQMYYSKGQIDAKINGALTKDATLNIDLEVTALVPDSGEVAVSYDLAEGTNPGYYTGLELDVDALANLITPITDGELSLDIDSTTVAKSNITFASATTWDDVISILNTAFPTATFSYSAESYRIKITSKTTGSTSNVTLNAWTSVGTDLSIAANLALAGGSAVTGS